MLLNEFLKEHQKVHDLEATVARQPKQIEALTSGLEKVSASRGDKTRLTSSPGSVTASNTEVTRARFEAAHARRVGCLDVIKHVQPSPVIRELIPFSFALCGWSSAGQSSAAFGVSNSDSPSSQYI